MGFPFSFLTLRVLTEGRDWFSRRVNLAFSATLNSAVDFSTSKVATEISGDPRPLRTRLETYVYGFPITGGLLLAIRVANGL